MSIHYIIVLRIHLRTEMRAELRIMGKQRSNHKRRFAPFVSFLSWFMLYVMYILRKISRVLILNATLFLFNSWPPSQSGKTILPWAKRRLALINLEYVQYRPGKRPALTIWLLLCFSKVSRSHPLLLLFLRVYLPYMNEQLFSPTFFE